ncbi:NUDIX hydrolase [Natronomonas marina]|jgi:8-oxo-dGTP diphosphatase|uniref:NUDIX hydrolase n=1 Tax=Natronomonas marina TaxID=2961939 RepID=UPI0020C99AAB|nr:NUDIX domain-containing protein [Natronomonas marina]
MSPTPDELAARYGDVYRKAERIEIDAERFDRGIERGDDGAWGVGALVVDSGRVLLVREGDIWLLPGGRLESDETPEAGAVREVREETGVDAEITGLGAIAEQTFRRDGSAATFDFRFATFLADPVSTDIAADPGRPGEGIDEAAWHGDVPENTFDRDLVVRLAREFM